MGRLSPRLRSETMEDSSSGPQFQTFPGRSARHLRERGRRYLGAGIVLTLGAFVYWEASDYARGSLLRMGPGYFPTMLSWLLVALGIALAVGAFRSAPESRVESAVRSCLAVLSAVAVFGVVLERFGMAPAVMLCVLVSLVADRRVSAIQSIVIASLLTLLSVAVFVGALRLSIPVAKW